MNRPGPSRPCSGCCQRTSASAPRTRPSARRDERLVVQHELAPVHPAAQLGEQRRPCRLAGVAVGVEHRDLPAALGLRPRQRDARGPHQVRGPGRRRVRHGDADARRQRHGPPADPERQRHHLLDARRQTSATRGSGTPRARRTRRHRCASPGAGPRRGAAAWRPRPAAGRRGGGRARRSDRGEAVEVQRAQPEVRRRGGGEGAVQQLLAGRAVGQQRQRVLRGDLGHPPAQRPPPARGGRGHGAHRRTPRPSRRGRRAAAAGSRRTGRTRRPGARAAARAWRAARPRRGAAGRTTRRTGRCAGAHDRPSGSAAPRTARRGRRRRAGGAGRRAPGAGPGVRRRRAAPSARRGPPRRRRRLPARPERRRRARTGRRCPRRPGPAGAATRPPIGRSGRLGAAITRHLLQSPAGRPSPGADRTDCPLPPCPDATRRGTDSPGSVTARLLFVEPAQVRGR